MDQNNQNIPEQPRQPKNLQDVIRYAIEARDPSDDLPVGGQVVNSKPLEPERKQFLEDAFTSMAVNSAQALAESIQTIKGLPSKTDIPDTYEQSLDVIGDYVDNIDSANEFVQLGGFHLIDICFRSEHSGIRWRMADIIAQCTQNNPFCQREALNLSLLPKLFHMVDEDADDVCKTKAFFAVSNIVRASTEGLEEFKRLNGLHYVKNALKSNISSLRNKAAFFFCTVISNSSGVESDLVKMGFPELFISLLEQEPNASHEYVALSLLTFAQQKGETWTICKKSDLHFEQTLRNIINVHGTDESLTEFVDSAKELLKLITSG